MKTGVIGLGYVGLTLSVHLAKRGMRVCGVDTSNSIIDALRKGKAYFFENDFNRCLKETIKNGKFTFGSDLAAIKDCNTYIIAVGTPLNNKGRSNLTGLRKACEDLKEHLKDNDLVILRSTVCVGVTRGIAKPILDQSRKKYRLAFCPERTLEGNALLELSSLPQIISGINKDSLSAAVLFFKSFCLEIVPLGSVEEAEMVKLINNSERDLMFAFANEIALICDSKGLNAHRIIKAANYKYPRSNIKKPGPVGGPCLEKDPYLLAEGFLDTDYAPKLFLQSRSINENMISISINRLFDQLIKQGYSSFKKISLLGFAFKGVPPTSDTRGSPIHSIIKTITSVFPDASLIGHDYLIETRKEIQKMKVPVVNTVFEAVKDSDLVIIQNNHPKYCQEDWTTLTKQMKKDSIIYDFWNQLDPGKFNNEVQYLRFGASNKQKSIL